jgi:hypothetical protein
MLSALMTMLRDLISLNLTTTLTQMCPRSRLKTQKLLTTPDFKMQWTGRLEENQPTMDFFLPKFGLYCDVRQR